MSLPSISSRDFWARPVPPKPDLLPFGDYPQEGCVMVYAKTQTNRMHDPYENPHVGWVAFQGGSKWEVGPFPKLHLAQQAAKDQFPEIISWKLDIPYRVAERKSS